MKKLTGILFLIAVLTIIYTRLSFGQSEQFVEKKGGICFRVDDNHSISEFQEFANVFDFYGLKATFAINLGKYPFSNEYVNMLKGLQSNGHELMDHTSDHVTSYFITPLSTDYYKNHPGVHRINDKMIELEHEPVNIDDAKRSGIVDINGDIITSSTGDFANFSQSDCYLYFPAIDQLVKVDRKIGWVDANTLIVRSVWGNRIDLSNHQNIRFYNFDYSNVHLTVDAIKALAEESIRLAEYYGIQKPKSWIQPGGYHPRIHKNELKEALAADLDYTAGAVYPSPSLKVFNEYNPNNDNAFGMQWGDFYDDTWTLEKIKSEISDNISKNRVLIGHSHFSGLLGEWDGYLERIDDILEWCIASDIPVRTYTKWADLLYNQVPNPYQNAFPKLYIDRDKNNNPDGYSKKKGMWQTDDGVEISNQHSFSISQEGDICFVDDLGGIEKGENSFEIWTKGSPGNYIEVVFNVGADEYIYTFPAENTHWQKYSLEQSLNGNTSLTIPEWVSLIDITIRCSIYNSGEVKISGMYLGMKQQKKIYELDSKVFLEGAYLANNTMATGLSNYIPINQPFNRTPWNYSGEESVENIPNGDIVDWILVSLYSDSTNKTPSAVRAGFLLSNGKIVEVDGSNCLRFNIVPGNYFVKIEQRNHLSIMSSSAISFNE